MSFVRALFSGTWAGRYFAGGTSAFMRRITTHVLDTAAGRPAAGLKVVLTRLDGKAAGCGALMLGAAGQGELKRMFVDPAARGIGLGRQLVDECIRFARICGYRKLTLWTQDNLRAARHIYQAAGFQCVKRDRHSSFGHALVGETWELPLRPAAK